MNRYTSEQYEIAKNVDLVEFLKLRGYNLKKVGREYCLKEHDSLRINNNKWYWHSKGIGGSPIQFLQVLENKTLVESVCELSQNKVNYLKSQPKDNIYNIRETEQKREIQLPEPNQNNKRVIAYLTKTRGLDYEVVNHFIKNGYIYESKDKHNCVFIGKDENGKSKYASMRSTISHSSFKQDVLSSDKSIGFTISNPKSKKVYVFESPIDLLSHCTFVKELTAHNFREQNRVSLGGLSEKALDNFLSKNKNIKTIVLNLDNDSDGSLASNKMLKKYKSRGYEVLTRETEGKDLNTDLLNYKKKQSIAKNIEVAKSKTENRSSNIKEVVNKSYER